MVMVVVPDDANANEVVDDVLYLSPATPCKP